MKKIFIIVLPILITIAVLFAIQDREFNSRVFLETFSKWRFDNGLDWLQRAGATFNKIGTDWNAVKVDSNIFKLAFDVWIYMLKSLVNIIVGSGQIIITIGAFIVDLFNNVKNVTDYLFMGV